MTRAVITGAGGQVGSELLRQVWPSDFEVVSFERSTLDITDSEAIAREITTNTSIVINVAAFTAVDRAEKERELAWHVNERGPRMLAERCAQLDIPLIHVSTDYVFDGHKTSPYLECDDVGPLNEYGRSKLAGETSVRAALARHIILRTSSVFGQSGTNFVKTMLRLGAEQDTLKIVADQVSCPTPARDIASAIVTICESITANQGKVEWGTYHFCGFPEVSWSEFASVIFRQWGDRIAAHPRIVEIQTKDYRTDARRPIYSVMGCQKIAHNFRISQPKWAEGLEGLLNATSNGGSGHGH